MGLSDQKGRVSRPARSPLFGIWRVCHLLFRQRSQRARTLVALSSEIPTSQCRSGNPGQNSAVRCQLVRTLWPLWELRAPGTGHLDFWARDSTVELWLYLLTQTIDARHEPPPWLRHARDDWHLQATAGMVGCVSANFDRHLAHNPAREAVLLALLGDLRDRIAAYGPAIPVDVVNSFGTGGPRSSYLGDADTAVLHRFTDAVTGLVRGHVAWDTAGHVHGVWE
jgi:hypothetical protein